MFRLLLSNNQFINKLSRQGIVLSKRFFCNTSEEVSDFLINKNNESSGLNCLVQSNQINKLNVYMNNLKTRNPYISVEIDFMQNPISTIQLKYSGTNVKEVLDKISYDISKLKKN